MASSNFDRIHFLQSRCPQRFIFNVFSSVLHSLHFRPSRDCASFLNAIAFDLGGHLGRCGRCFVDRFVCFLLLRLLFAVIYWCSLESPPIIFYVFNLLIMRPWFPRGSAWPKRSRGRSSGRTCVRPSSTVKLLIWLLWQWSKIVSLRRHIAPNVCPWLWFQWRRVC